MLPLVFLRVVDFAPPIHLVVDKSAHDVNEALNRAHRVVCVGVVHLGYRLEYPKNLVVAMAALQVNVGLLDETTNQVDGASFGGDASGVKWNFVLHLNWLLFKLPGLDSINLRAALVPLKRMQSLRQVRSKTGFDIVVNSEVAVDEIIEVVDNFVCVLVK